MKLTRALSTRSGGGSGAPDCSDWHPDVRGTRTDKPH